MKRIPLTKSKVALVDDYDYDFLMHFGSWCITNGKSKVIYAVNRDGEKLLLMHRLILEVDNPNIEVDHIDHDGLNNQRHNLRIATHQQNQFNRNKSKNNTSGYKGVGFSKWHNKFYASIMINYKGVHLGFYDTAIEAAMAYDEAAKELHGDFSNLNFK